jgi:PAS domain S-box-containing protein
MRLGALRIAIIYIVLGVLWITLSDQILFLLKNELSNSAFQLAVDIKRVFYVVVTGLLLWMIIKRDDERLVESEKQYRSVYENSPIPMWIYDPVTLKFSSVNKTTVNNYGYSEDVFLQMSVLDIRPPDEVAAARDEMENVSESILQSGPWVHKKADGTLIYVSITAQKIIFNKKPHVIVMAQDINERVVFEQRLKKLNNDLREKRGKLSETQKIAKVAGWELFLENNYMVWSDEMHIITAIGPLQNDNMFDLYIEQIHADDRDKVIEKINLLSQTGEAMDITHRMTLNDGSIHYVRLVAKLEYLLDIPYKIVGSAQDITEFKLLELERNKYFISLEDTLNTISESFFALDKQLHFTKVNAQFEEETGFKSADVIGKYLINVFPVVGEDSACSKFRQVIANGRSAKFEEYSYSLNKWLAFSVYPTEEGLAIYFQDITEQKEKDLQLKEALNRYDMVSKATRDVIYDYDIVNDVIIYNTSLSQLVNCDMDKINYNLNWWRSLIHPDDLLEVINSQERVLADKETNWWCEYRINCGDDIYKYVYDQGYFLYDENNQPIRLIGAVKDIDALKRSDEENRRLAEIITKVNNMVMVINNDDVISWVNKAFEDYTGYNFWSIVGERSDSFLTKLHIPTETIAVINERKSKLETFSIEVEHHSPLNGYQWLEIEYNPLYSESGKHNGYIAVHQNITVRKEKEERIKHQNKTLQEIAWLSSHEVRRPVASILGLVYLAKDLQSPEDKEEIMEMINRCAEELDGIVHLISERVNEEADLQAE